MWIQNYDPMNSAVLSTLLAGAPVVILLGLLASGVSAARSAAAGLLAALLVSIFGFGMPADAALAAAGYGAAFGLLPIGWIVVSAVFLFQLTIRSGQFEIVKRSIAALSPDMRIQALFIAFSFGAFLEGAAGFGTPVAISAALLIGLGFAPLQAAALALIANTSPVAFGALGTPIITLAKVSGLDEMSLSQMAGRQLPLFSLIVPAWLVATMGGWRALAGVWPAVLVCGGSFAVVQFFVSNYMGPALVDVAGGVGSLVASALFLKFFWQPRVDPKFLIHSEPGPPLRFGQVALAWLPWMILSAAIFCWGWPAIKAFLNGGTAASPNFLHGVSKPSFAVPRLDGRVYRAPPVAPPAPGKEHAADPEAAVYDFSWLAATGTAIFFAAMISTIPLRIGIRAFFFEFAGAVHRVRWALFTIMCMLALAFTTKYSGCDATLGLAFTKTGWWYPLFAPMLGWLGVALTGSDTSSNALFGSLQRITAEQLGLNPTLIVASNSTGGVMGKMIDAQSIVVAAVATDRPGDEGPILRYVFPHSVCLALMVGLLTLAQATFLSWMTP